MRRLNLDRNLEQADWIKKVRGGKAQKEDLKAHRDAMLKRRRRGEEMLFWITWFLLWLADRADSSPAPYVDICPGCFSKKELHRVTGLSYPVCIECRRELQEGRQ